MTESGTETLRNDTHVVEGTHDSRSGPDEADSTASLLLRRKHNLDIPFGRLPDDIFEEIAIHYVDFWRSMERHIEAFGWRDIMAVNSRLRSVIIETPSIWTTISLDWPTELRDIFHTRAKGLPLNVRTDKYIGLNEHQSQMAGKFLSQNIGTISSLVLNWHADMELEGGTGSPKLSTFLKQHIGTHSFPRLKHAAFFDEGAQKYRVFGHTITINAPVLETLVLETMVLKPTKLSPFPRLTNLEIRNLITFADEIIPLLAVCPALEFCSIETEDPSEDIDDNINLFRWDGRLPRIQILHLPALKVLTIAGFRILGIMTVLRLLQNSPHAEISFPGTRWVEYEESELDGPFSDSLQEVLQPQIRNFDQLVVDQVNQSCSSWRESKFRLCSMEDSSPDIGHLKRGRIDLEFSKNRIYKEDGEGDPLVPLFSILPDGFATHLSSLHLIDSTPECPKSNKQKRRPHRRSATLPSPALLLSGFRYLPNLTILRLSGWKNIDNLLVAFGSKGLESTSGSDGGVPHDRHLLPCPSLRHFEFQDSQFTPGILIQFLQERQRVGMKVSMLKVTGSLLDERLRSIVRALVLDFVEEPPHDMNICKWCVEYTSSLAVETAGARGVTAGRDMPLRKSEQEMLWLSYRHLVL
ncbi:hypothetical protein SISNIDRAFT_550956 [Sistotremastrum niveocremeum HHB9708]|uniref:F-box domain-containing protein n=1 Tax=Sistotremastrum niveocremeum HHB9708 TaxID=1314777 RepID=A0A164SDX4_9AGAM|nr:hypothetical protein SISNIDRAFT_550956 [Sistotremastrum niveocremeum HHB9708]